MGYGKLVTLNLNPVKNSAAKTINFLESKLAQQSLHDLAVIFLGETHRNEIDQKVTAAMLAEPPVTRPNATWVLFERGLDQVNSYIPSATAVTHTRVEKSPADWNGHKRSLKIADMVKDIFDDSDGPVVVYIPCGSAHGSEIFAALDKKMTQNFSFMFKKTVTE
ncbi:MAG: hypothetical protein AAGM22_33255 [Acidobacteriota bacterium]